MTISVPNFFIVGAAKSGTTSVARYLGEHPQVFMSPIKEPSYFARDIVESLHPPGWARNQRGLDRYLRGPMLGRRGGCVLEWEAYLKLFRNLGDKVAIGEASTAYLISPMAPSDIRSAIPDARILMVLRSPIERAFSTYQMFCRNGRLRASFSEVIKSGETGRLADWRRMILETRRIAPGVERFLNTFPRSQIRWYYHEDLSTDPLAVMEKIYRFLQVDPAFRPDVSRRYNEELLPKAPFLHYAAYASGVLDLAYRVVPARARPVLRNVLFQSPPKSSISIEDRKILADYFRDDVRHLSRLVDRDLLHWLDLR
jgi:hypothetical protein